MSETQTTYEAAEGWADAPESGEEAAKEAFFIDTPGKLEWYLKTLGAMESEKARVAGNAAKILGDLDKQIGGFRAHFDPQVQAFAEKEIPALGKGKSLPTLYGTVSLRTVAKHVSIPAEKRAEAEAWARAYQPDLVTEKVTVTLDTRALQKRLAASEGGAVDAATGELVSWAVVVPERQSMTISTGKQGGQGE